MNRIIQSLLLLIVVLSVQCTKDADIALPVYASTLVVHSYICPKDSGVVVYLNMSQPAYIKTGGIQFVKDATVKISDGIKSTQLNFFDSQNGFEYPYYYVDSTTFKIAAGKTYTLNVSTPDGKSASASTTVPDEVGITSINYKQLIGNFQDSVYRINFEFNDPLGQNDYYKFGVYLLDIDTVINDSVCNSNNERFGTYFSSDGALIRENIEVPKYSWLSPEQIRVIDFRLLHVSREYYLYHQSIQNQGGGPFSEPSVAFTNIVGGVGVFAGYNYVQKWLR